MAKIEVTAKVNDGDNVLEGTVEYDFGDDLAQMVEKFGDEVVYSNALANMKVALQGRMRPLLKEGKDVKILETMWRPGVQMGKVVDPVSAVKAAFSTMSEEERAALLQTIQQLAQG